MDGKDFSKSNLKVRSDQNEGQQLRKLRQHLRTNLVRTHQRISSNSYELSIYFGELTQEVIMKQISKISLAFPNLEKGFYSILSERIKALDFSNERLEHAVQHVIDNCVYPAPTIANFISYDKKIRFYTYLDMSKLVDIWGSIVWNHYDSIKLDELTVWAKKSDLKLIGYEKTKD